MAPDSAEPSLAQQSDGVLANRALARHLAAALGEPAVRNGLLQAMKQSPVYEDKLHLESFLTGGGPGQALLQQMASASDASTDSILSLVAAAPDLEMYLPVPAHREEWKGGTDYLVATTLTEDAEPYGVDPSGTEVELSADSAPSTPTIVLGRTESFEENGLPRLRSLVQAPGPSLSENCDETSVEECDDTGSGYGDCEPVPSGPNARGIGIRERTFCVRHLNDHEPWHRGAPEFEIRLTGTEDTDSVAEVANSIGFPNSTWDSADEGDWVMHEVNLFDLDTDMGNRVAIECFEDDPDDDQSLDVEGTTEFSVGPVTFSFTFSDLFGDGDDLCGQFDLLLKTSTGEYTTFRQDPDGAPDGTSDFEWLSYGIDLTS